MKKGVTFKAADQKADLGTFGLGLQNGSVVEVLGLQNAVKLAVGLRNNPPKA